MPILMNGDGIGFWVCGGGGEEEAHAVGHLLALNPAGRAHGVPLQKLGRYLCRTADLLQPLPGFLVDFFCLERTSVTLLGGQKLMGLWQHPRLREYPVLPASCLPDCRFQLFSLTADFFLPAPGLAPPRPPVLLDFVGIFSPLFRKISSPPAGCL